MWVGYLNRHDPLYSWLKKEIFPQFSLLNSNAKVEVYQLTASNRVYLYKTFQNGSTLKVVGKFYGKNSDSDKRKRFLLMKEFENIQRLKDIGFHRGSCQVVKCLGKNEYINYVLMTEYAEGPRLDHYIKESIFKNRNSSLYNALSKLAHFLYLLHSRSRKRHTKVDFKKEYAYFHKTLSCLMRWALVSHKDANSLHKLAHKWKHNTKMLSAPSVQIHGDCTPTNFIFSEKTKVVALDLERSKKSDPAFDTGRVTGELKHHFMMFTGDGWKSEPFIQHFYKEYLSQSKYLTNPSNITERSPFYQAITELRIAKNDWISTEHRRQLIDDAKKCLKY